MRRRRRRRWKRSIAVLAVIVAVAALGLRFYFGRDAEDALREGEQVDFAHLALAQRGNVFLMCPSEPAMCNQPADAASPVFAIDATRLRDRWLEVVAREPRVHLVMADGERRHLVYIQHSAFFRFPDIVTVEFVPLGAERSTLAVLSRSRYGSMDMGVNAERVRRWVNLLVAVTGSG